MPDKSFWPYLALPYQNPLIPQSVENIVLKATAKNPKNRYDSIRQMHDDIVHALDAENENFRTLIDSLENGVYTLDANLNEVEASIALINNDPQSVIRDNNFEEEYEEEEEEPVAPPSRFDRFKSKLEEESYDDDDEDDDEDYDDDDYDDDDDDFLDD